jgi:rubrerythrin
MEKKKLQDLVKQAIRLEIDGRKFFNHAAEITLHELGKKMFQRLAQEEVKHLTTFGKLFGSMVKAEDWKEYVKKEEKLSEKSPLIEELASRMKKPEAKGEVEALRIGMELEQNAVEMFKKTSADVTDTKIKEIFDKICDEERFHFDLLQAQHDSVTGSGFWLDSSEFQMDGKY